ncbi:hypothetical protein [Serinibacter salmoneus]|uniref:Uncharacterized protein n=1 Tax=Serinibacter salmoneus TaxID=556530 RepID=A0A2A9D182_9MICO|nr:hypothetical protein [Serinibacter salmoneus]PFG20126.1 hypothetical protein ATL40_1711 [Serinibacter salmoneus]
MKKWVSVTTASIALVVLGGVGVAYAMGPRVLEGGERTREFSQTASTPLEGVGGCAEVTMSGTVAVHYVRIADVLDRERELLSELRIREPVVEVSTTGCDGEGALDVAQVTIASAFAGAECVGEWRLEEAHAEGDGHDPADGDAAAYAPACSKGPAAVRTTMDGPGSAFEQHQSNAELAVEGRASGREGVELCAAAAVAVAVSTEQNEEDLALVDLGEICFTR